MSPAKPKAKLKKAKRPTKKVVPWEQVEALFVLGEDGPADGSRFYPSQSDLARRFGISPGTVSEKAKEPDANGKTWAEKKNSHLHAVQAKTSEAVAEKIVGQEVAFREMTLLGAQLAAQHCLAQLHRGLRKDSEGRGVSTLPADSITKLTGALRKAQETGLVAMDRPADGGPASADESDWTLMRKVRAGGSNLKKEEQSDK